MVIFIFIGIAKIRFRQTVLARVSEDITYFDDYEFLQELLGVKILKHQRQFLIMFLVNLVFLKLEKDAIKANTLAYLHMIRTQSI